VSQFTNIGALWPIWKLANVRWWWWRWRHWQRGLRQSRNVQSNTLLFYLFKKLIKLQWLDTHPPFWAGRNSFSPFFLVHFNFSWENQNSFWVVIVQLECWTFWIIVICEVMHSASQSMKFIFSFPTEGIFVQSGTLLEIESKFQLSAVKSVWSLWHRLVCLHPHQKMQT
jgi:hypothetical protein